MEIELDYGPVRVLDESADTAFVIFFFFWLLILIHEAYTRTYMHTLI